MEDEQNNDMNQNEDSGQNQDMPENVEVVTDEEFEPVTVKQVAVKWGLYLGMVMIIYGMILQVTDQVANQSLGYVNYLFMAILIYFAQKSFKDDGNGFMSYSKGLGIGTLVSVVGGAISSVFTYIYLTFIDDSMIATILEKAEMDMIDRGTPDAQVEQAMSITEKMMTPLIMSLIGLFFVVLLGFILSLIISAINKNSNPDDQV